jgi:hypothetical protein
MRYRSIGALVAFFVTGLAAGAQAQDKPVVVSLGGGFTMPNSDVRDRLGDGYNFNFGVQVNTTPVIGIEFLYSFNGLGDKDIEIPVFPTPVPGAGTPTRFDVGMNMQYGTVNLIAQKPDGGVRPYGLVGGGIYYRPIEVTTPGVGWIPGYCDPWWYVCYPGGWVETTNVVGKRSSTDFGMDFGGGVNFGSFFAELRYHYIWGPTIEGQVTTLPAATASNASLAGTKANGQFIATTFGVRF